jgi:hypothetical protein
VEPGDAVLDDLERPAVAGGEGRQARGHGLDDGEAEGLEQGRLDESAAAVGDEAIELPGEDLVELHSQPAHLAVEAVAIHQLVHPGDLRLFLAVLQTPTSSASMRW